MQTISDKKKQLRRMVKMRVATLSAIEKEKRATALLQKVFAHPAFQQAQRIMLFWSLPDEINSLPLIEHALAVGKQVYLPVVKDDILLIKPYNATQMAVGAFSINEPQGAATYSASEMDLIIVPGVAFDVYGNRMGRGKGYYDKLLTNATAYTIGVGYAEQSYLSIPVEEHDKVLNEIIVV